ncbi:hypothetical protein Patl1_37069 [Pistacia atlantica]|nr:hypothetical protein Patl1_37069 [Pistacia atlantica]
MEESPSHGEHNLGNVKTHLQYLYALNAMIFATMTETIYLEFHFTKESGAGQGGDHGRSPGNIAWDTPTDYLWPKEEPVEGFYLDYYTKMHWGGYRSLPPWDPNIPFQRAVVYSLPPNSWGRCEISIMVLTGISHPAFVFPRLKEGGNYIYEWIMQDCTIADPHCISIIEDINSHLRITALGRKPAHPSVSSRHFRECILESNGEILLVFLISCNSINIVDDVEVFQLDIGTLLWVKMQKLGDRTLILGSNCSMSVSASKLGCRRDCVYFSHHRDTVEGWWVYDFERGRKLCLK